jgi:hypothetical protein
MRKTQLLMTSALLLAGLAAAHAQSPTGGQMQGAPSAAPTQQQRAPGATATPPAAPNRGVVREMQTTPPPARISSHVTITPDQRYKISQVLSNERSNATNVSFPLTAGATIPAAIHLKPVPPEVVAAASEYRGRSFFVTPDAIVIVNPRGREIVSAFSFSDREAALVPSPTRETVALSATERDMIHREILPGSATGPAPKTTHAFAVGDAVPPDAALEEFPPSIAKQIPQVGSYRYYRSGRDVVVVDPSSRQVLSVID